MTRVNGLSVGYNDRNHIANRQSPDGAVQYAYDSRDQLVRVETSSGVWEAEYDALGRRTRKISAGQTTEYHWNMDQLIAEVRPDGTLRLYLDADPLALSPLLFLDYGSTDAPVDACRRYFVFSDQIGTPCLIEDESGAELWRARIDPYGRAQIAADARFEFNLRFPGHYFDGETGLHYNRCRYYDPALGRYLQSDPWDLPAATTSMPTERIRCSKSMCEDWVRKTIPKAKPSRKMRKARRHPNRKEPVLRVHVSAERRDRLLLMRLTISCATKISDESQQG